MNNKEIIERAARIVRNMLDCMADNDGESVNISKSELISISSALAVASIMHYSDEEGVGRL